MANTPHTRANVVLCGKKKNGCRSADLSRTYMYAWLVHLLLSLSLSLDYCRQLLRDPNVLYAGYKVPHPLENHIEIKVQVRAGATLT